MEYSVSPVMKPNSILPTFDCALATTQVKKDATLKTKCVKPHDKNLVKIWRYFVLPVACFFTCCSSSSVHGVFLSPTCFLISLTSSRCTTLALLPILLRI